MDALDRLSLDDVALLGAMMEKARNYPGAVEVFRYRAEALPDDALAWRDLGGALNKLGKFEDAVEATRRALALDPNDPVAHAHLAHILRSMGETSKARAAVARALEIDPDHARHHLLSAELLLAAGDLEQGFREYEWRLRIDDLFAPARQSGAPMWDGRPLSAGLLLTAEQGFGDTLQFCRYVPLAAARAKRTVLFVPAPLSALLGSLPGIEVYPFGMHTTGPFDAAANVGSLHHLLGLAESIPAETPYLTPPAEAFGRWRGRIDGPGLRVGLCWRGNPEGGHDRGRSMTLADLAPLSAVGGVTFHSLQRDATADERAAWRGTLVDLGSRIESFADTAAAIAGLDLVITTDTAVAHVAGALGAETWLMLKRYPSWRWGLEGERTPWYPTLRLFRQPAIGDWPSVVAAVAGALETRSGLE